MMQNIIKILFLVNISFVLMFIIIKDSKNREKNVKNVTRIFKKREKAVGNVFTSVV